MAEAVTDCHMSAKCVAQGILLCKDEIICLVGESCMLLSKVLQQMYDCCCCANCSLVLFLVLFSLFFMVGFHLFHACHVCCSVVNSEISIAIRYWVISQFFSG
jgi:hypothetical protein